MIAIAVGSNIDPERNIEQGLRLLHERVTVRAVSTFYRTEPVGVDTVHPFLNGVFDILTDSPPIALKFDILRAVEDACGRTRGAEKFVDRTLDLDILVYHEELMDHSGLELPDPDILSRPFLWQPLLELNPGLTLPGRDAPLAVLTQGLPTGSLEPEPGVTDRLRRIVAAGGNRP